MVQVFWTLRVLSICFFVYLYSKKSEAYAGSSGIQQQGQDYTITCGSGYFISVYLASWGSDYWDDDTFVSCWDSDSTTDLDDACAELSACTFQFNNALFGNPCPGISKEGEAKWYCGRDAGWSDWSPWTSCPVLCGGGVVSRSRPCDNPTREYPGSYCEGSDYETTSCNSQACPDNAQLVHHRGPWRLVFKVPSGVAPSGHTDVVSFLKDSGSYNDGSVSAMRDFSSGGSLYKSAIWDDWATKHSISAVRLSVYKDGQEVTYVVFDAAGVTSRTGWMDCSRVIDSSWTDLQTGNPNVCGIEETGVWKRNFFINKKYDDCQGDAGWLMFKDVGASNGCDDWDTTKIPLPYIMYSTDSTYATWHNGNTGYGDALAIFVMDWHMVFKGVDGTPPLAGSLQDLWEGNDTERDNDTSARTITTFLGQTYKSGLIEEWTDTFMIVDMVKYSFYTNAEEVSWVVFNGKDTDKTSWFSSSNILYSQYTDVSAAAKSTCSISGDGMNTFAIVNDDSSCPWFRAWMMVVDSSGGSPMCSFDSDVRPKPYFLHSASTNAGLLESGGKWDNTGFPAADVLGVFVIGWFPVMKVALGQSVSPAHGIYDLWTKGYTLNEFDKDALSFQYGTKSFKSSVVDSWNNFYIRSVRVSFYSSGVERAYVVFDAHGSDKVSWFDCDRILYTSYKDLNGDTPTIHCSIPGDNALQRYFFLEYEYNGCSADAGWFGIMEAGSGCNWEQRRATPYALYSDNNNGFEINTNMAIADVFVISVGMEDHCSMVTCANGATCYDRGITYDCECTGDFYGILCENLDGGWTEWSNWTVCSTTCYAAGTQTRVRQCTNPSKVGEGLDCPGEASETVDCIPDFPICDEYNTGDMVNNTIYQMVCPKGYYVFVESAFYGNDVNDCIDTSATTKLASLCHGVNENCTFSFNSNDFGDPCWRYAKQGNATLYCARDGVWSTWQAWTYCSVTCGGGTRTRRRTCDTPTTVSPGLYCPDSPDDSKACMTEPCPVCGHHYAGYDDPRNISIYNDTSKENAYILLDINWDIPCCELISAWEFVPITTGLIDFHIWRKQFNGLHLLASSITYMVNESQVGQLVNFTLPPGERITVLEGDEIGWYCPGDNMIPYADCSGEMCPNKTRKSLFSTRPSKLQVFDWESLPEILDRAYAIRFFTHANTMPYVNQTEFVALVKDFSPIGTRALPYWITDEDVDDFLTHSFTHELFELNTTFANDIHIQTKSKMPKEYNVFSLVLRSWDMCSNTATTTVEITTYNAPPMFLNLPEEISIAEDVSTPSLLYELDVVDYSENDSICCTLSEVTPWSPNFRLAFIDNGYQLFTTEQAAFDYKEISNYYRVRLCCSDSYGVSSNFLEVFITDVRKEKLYSPPTWFLTAIGICLVPVTLLLFSTCCLMCATFCAEPDVEYFFSR
ncbi:uncharacterized protein LOC110455207 [Mizuhopecten yessoensis]|uniref:Hemicentin-1 n=1 Tax=Mizuhopecten yessoensis TaxID=6573 RepID=A0A210QDH8_MIZYE|nr:uncharacterized protein LOC110455207 [Mizuhopecten yessoensis]OWF46785.1 Hemicentin-1 [Mizuhopecten yessoensis]